MLESELPGYTFIPLQALPGVSPDLRAIAAFLALAVLLIGTAMISGFETAFFSLSPARAGELKESFKGKKRTVAKLLDDPGRLRATLLIVKHALNTGIVLLSAFITITLVDFSRTSFWPIILAQFAAIVALIVVFGEMLPASYAAKNSMRLARMMASPLWLLSLLLYPFSSLLMRYRKVPDRHFNGNAHTSSGTSLPDAVERSTGHNTPEEDKKLLKGIVRFGDTEVKEIMRSRMDVAAVDMSMKFDDLLKFIIQKGYSRIPVYEDNFDNVRGILYIKDLLAHLEKGEGFAWQKLLREAFYVPEMKKIDDLLKEFQEKKIHLAIVVDEYGGTSGIITLEDIIEEIVGEISDEHDEPLEEIVYSRLSDNTYIFEGKTSLNDFYKVTEIADDLFDGVRGDADSLAGLLLELFKKMPEKDESVVFDRFRFTVKAVDKRRIKRIQVVIDKPGS